VMSWFQRYVIRHALKKPTPERISSSDDRIDAKSVLVGFSGPGSIEYRVVGIGKNEFRAYHFEKNGDPLECAIPFSRVNGMHLTIRYFYRGDEIKYQSASRYIWGMMSFEAWRNRVVNKFRQIHYNRSLKIRGDRTEVLQVIVDDHLRRRSREGAPVLGEIRIDRWEVLQLVYGTGIWGHPRRAEISARLDLIVDSLVDSGDLTADQSRLIVKGKSVASLSSRVEEDRKHRDQIGYNKAIKWLTGGLLITAIAQVLVAYIKS
jgi:hypothetical protein